MKSVIIFLGLVALTSEYGWGTRHGKICDLCIETLDEVKSATTSEEVEKLVTDVATQVCMFAPKSEREDCKTFVAKIMKENFSLIREFTLIWGPEDICQIVHLCPKSDTLEVEGKICTVCEDSMAAARYLLTDPTLETVIKDYLETACSVTGPLSPLCKREVGQLVDLVFSEIKAAFDTMKDEDICKALHLCRHDGVTNAPSLALSSSVSVCDACTATVDEIESIIKLDQLEKVVEDIAGISCSLLPGKVLTDQCNEITQDFIEEFFYNAKEIMEVFDGATICQIAHLCKSESELELLTGLHVTSPSPLCELCEDSLTLSQNILMDPDLEIAVNTDMKFACAFTAIFHKKCEQFVDTFTSTLFGQIRQTFDQFDQHKSCVLFNFCEDLSNKTTICDVCMDSFGTVSDFMTSDSLQTLVEDQVDLVCRATGFFSRICIEEANKVIDIAFDIIHKVFKLETAEKFCSQVHLCKRRPLF